MWFRLIAEEWRSAAHLLDIWRIRRTKSFKPDIIPQIYLIPFGPFIENNYENLVRPDGANSLCLFSMQIQNWRRYVFFKLYFKTRKTNEIRKTVLSILFVLTIRMYWCAWFGCRAKIEEVLTKTLQHSPTRKKTCFFFEFWILKPNGNEIRKSAFYILCVLTRQIHWCAWFRCRSKIEEKYWKNFFGQTDGQPNQLLLQCYIHCKNFSLIR